LGHYLIDIDGSGDPLAVDILRALDLVFHGGRLDSKI
jgi:hypothetical protein